MEPSFQRGTDLYEELMAMSGTPVAFEDLIPLPEGFEGDVIEEPLVEDDVEDLKEDAIEEVEVEGSEPVMVTVLNSPADEVCLQAISIEYQTDPVSNDAEAVVSKQPCMIHFTDSGL